LCLFRTNEIRPGARSAVEGLERALTGTTISPFSGVSVDGSIRWRPRRLVCTDDGVGRVPSCRSMKPEPLFDDDRRWKHPGTGSADTSAGLQEIGRAGPLAQRLLQLGHIVLPEWGLGDAGRRAGVGGRVVGRRRWA